jgi:hypothetical protein
MKTAIIFTGFVRSFVKYGHKLHIKLFEQFKNADIYYCAWDTIDANQEVKIPYEIFNNNSFAGLKLLNWNIHKNTIPTTIPIDRPNDIYKVNKFAIEQGIVSSNRIRSQWYLVKQSIDLIPKNYYDIIIRSRFDLNYTEVDIAVNSIQPGITIPYNFFSVHYQPNSDIKSGFCDHLAYGDEKSMINYLSMYDHFDKMYYENNANISHAEGMLKYYLTNYLNLKINFNDNILYQVVKSDIEIDSTPTRKYIYENNIS